MPGFFITNENIDNNSISVTNKTDINHITNVLRLKNGDLINLTNTEGSVYEVRISHIKSDKIETEILAKHKSNRKLNINITLAQSILKSQKQDIVIQKATELGVANIIPIISKNTVVRFDSDKDKKQKIERWQRIAYESSKQCQRINIPEISPIISLKELIELNNFDVKLVCSERDTEFSIKDFLNKTRIDKDSSILVFIGPEGGWDMTEIELFQDKKLPLVSLGNLILRAETASITAISDIVYEYEL